MSRYTLCLLFAFACSTVANSQVTFFEDFETFSLGPVDGQNGWTGVSGAQVVETHVPGFASQALRATDVGPNDDTYITSPVVGNGYGRFALDIKIDDPDPFAEYLVFPIYLGSATGRLHFQPNGLISLDRSIGPGLINDFLIGGSWSQGEVNRLEWRFTPDPTSVVTQQQILLNNEVIFEGSNTLGGGFDDQMDSFGIWSFGSFPADITIDNVIVESQAPTPDFNSDGRLDVLDIDALVYAIANESSNSQYDLNNDNVLDLQDRDEWLAIAGDRNWTPGFVYPLGDANLDTVVTVSDWNLWNQNKFTEVAAWSHGDFNADGFIDASDLNIWNSHKFNANSVVPEPSIRVFLLGILLWSFTFRRSLAWEATSKRMNLS